MTILKGLLYHFCITGSFLGVAALCFGVTLTFRQTVGIWLILLMLRLTNPCAGGDHK